MKDGLRTEIRADARKPMNRNNSRQFNEGWRTTQPHFKEYQMNSASSGFKRLAIPLGFLLVVLAAGCRGRDPILGGGGIATTPPIPPQVTLTVPVA